MYYVYILKSNVVDKYYIGSTKNLGERLSRHNSGRSKWTKRYKPWSIIYNERFSTRSEAFKREIEIKSYKSGLKFKQLLN